MAEENGHRWSRPMAMKYADPPITTTRHANTIPRIDGSFRPARIDYRATRFVRVSLPPPATVNQLDLLRRRTPAATN
jgi:hypothetical protein